MPELKSSLDVSWAKVIWSVLIIVIVGGLISGALFWYFVVRQPTESTPSTTKVATSSSKTATSSAKTASPSAKISASCAEKDEPAGWKTYSNSLAKFCFKYPSNLSDNGDGGKWGINLKSPDYMNQIKSLNSSKLTKGYLIDVYNINFMGDGSLLGEVEGWHEGAKILGYTSVSGVKAVKYSWWNWEADANYLGILIIKDHQNYFIEQEYPTDQKANEVLLNKIASTFEFL